MFYHLWKLYLQHKNSNAQHQFKQTLVLAGSRAQSSQDTSFSREEKKKKSNSCYFHLRNLNKLQLHISSHFFMVKIQCRWEQHWIEGASRDLYTTSLRMVGALQHWVLTPQGPRFTLQDVSQGCTTLLGSSSWYQKSVLPSCRFWLLPLVTLSASTERSVAPLSLLQPFK